MLRSTMRDYTVWHSMIDKALRVPKERMLTPLAARFMQHVHPTTVTMLSFGVGLVACGAIWQRAYGIGVVLWLTNRVLDGLDGTIARVNQKQSELGGYVDMLTDTAIYALVPSAIVLGAPSQAGWLSLTFLLASFYLNATSWMYLAALLEKRSLGAGTQGELTTITMPGGLVEGAETVLFFTLFLLFPSAHAMLFGVMGLLVYATVIQRFVWAVRRM